MHELSSRYLSKKVEGCTVNDNIDATERSDTDLGRMSCVRNRGR